MPDIRLLEPEGLLRRADGYLEFLDHVQGVSMCKPMCLSKPDRDEQGCNTGV